MLFNTYEFIFYFLLPALFVYGLIPYKFKIWFFIIISIVFYAQWDMFHLVILCLSIVVNYYFAYLISISFRTIYIYIIISLNILLLGYFKYSGFLNISDHNLVLPLAISFFTFQQITYIVDIYRKKIIFESFDKYLFFVLFFPQLIAGPIVHYREIMIQVKKGVFKSFNIEKTKAGLILFSIGLFKKVVIADNLAIISNSNPDAWSNLLSYSLMIYFDFSGYADMAIGLALFFGIALPMNFYSPYKASNIIEFWRRWHITLGIFLKEYIYIPLGGNRSGRVTLGSSLMITMLIGGIWHGAGWNFLLWGGLHGVGLLFLHLLKDKMVLPKFISIGFTFLFVTLLWVLFRNNSFDDSLNEYVRLFSFDFTNFLSSDIYIIVCCLLVVWFFPNSMQIVKLNKENFSLKKWHTYFAAILMFISLKFMAQTPSMSFVYFNF